LSDNPPIVLPIQDDIEPHVQRLVFQSKHGHSQLNISQYNATLATAYTGECQSDLDARLIYARERLSKIFAALSQTGVSANYTGISSRAFLKFEGTDSEFTTRVFPACIDHPPPNGAYDAAQKITTECSGRHYLIVVKEVVRNWGVPAEEMSTRRLPREIATTRGLSVQTDFNDRLAFHVGPDYHTTEPLSLEVLELGFRNGFAEAQRAAEVFNA
jgi:hypothetical protein